MAKRRRKKKSDDGGAIAILLILALIVGAALAVAWLTVVWLFREYAYQDKVGDPREVARFSPSEQSSLNRQRQNLARVSAEIRSILERGANLMRRKDGYFHAGSRLGKELNEQLERAAEERAQLREQVSALESLPVERFQEWSKLKSQLAGHRVAAGTLPVVWLVLVLLNSPEIATLGAVPVAFFVGDLPESDVMRYGNAVVASWIGIGVYNVGRLLVGMSHKPAIEHLKGLRIKT